MSAIQLLEQIGLDPSRSRTDNESLRNELEKMIDTCPDIISFLVPAEDDDKKDDDNEDEDRKEAVGF